MIGALASPSFRLAGQGVASTLCCGFRQCMLFPVWERGQTEWCICWSLLRVLAGCRLLGNHCSCGLRGLSLITALACTQCTIPFCRKREAVNREGGRHRQSRRWLVRTGLQNGIPNSPGCALAGCVPLSLMRWVSEGHLFRFPLLLRGGGSVWPVKVSL